MSAFGLTGRGVNWVEQSYIERLEAEVKRLRTDQMRYFDKQYDQKMLCRCALKGNNARPHLEAGAASEPEKAEETNG